VRKLRGPEYGPYGYKLQVIDVDRLWEQKNEAFDNGGAIHAGVEVDANAKPVAYHIIKRRPSQWQYSGYTLEFERVPADEMIHIFVPEFAEQVRGVPWMYAALLNLVHLGAFEEAAVIAARIGAANMGFIKSPDGGSTLAQQAAAGPDGTGTEKFGGSSGDPMFNAEPGAFPMLPPGYDVQRAGTRNIPTPRSSPSSARCCAAWRQASASRTTTWRTTSRT
jgi:lambda family phage portal protein